MRLLAVILFALALAVPALAAGPREAPALEPAASWVAGKPVQVWCGVTRLGDSYESGFAPLGGGNIYLAAGLVCQPLQTLLSHSGPAVSSEFGPGLEILAHESEHAKGILDESETECAALKVTAEVGIRFFGLRGQRRFLRDMMRAAWLQHRSAPEAYTRLC